MSPPAKMGSDKTTLELLEESAQLLRQLPAILWICYYAGTIPFLLGGLYFWVEMSSGGMSERRCVPGSLGLTLLFLWMKVGQTLFASGLRRHFGGESSVRWRLPKLLRIATIQGIIQPWRFVVLPLALIATFPFPVALAFFENVTSLGDGQGKESGFSFSTLIRRAYRQAFLRIGQNSLFVTLTTALYLVTWINTCLGCALLPYLIRMLLGIETAFTRAGSSAFLNTTFLAMTVALSYLVIDPLIKAVYSLRCFYGESIRDGRDLLSEFALAIGNSARCLPLLALIGFIVISPPLLAESTGLRVGVSSESAGASVSSAELNQAVDKTLAHDKYRWKARRQADSSENGPLRNWLRGFIDGIKDTLKSWFEAVMDAIAWLRRLFGSRDEDFTNNSDRSAVDWKVILRGSGLLLLCLATVAMAWLLWKVRQRSRQIRKVAQAEILPVRPDLNDEQVIASQLPEDGWLTLARELMEKGDRRLALRALYLANLANLAHRELVTLTRFKSNREYLMEVTRRAKGRPDLQSAFVENVASFDRAWYGWHDVTTEVLRQFQSNLERMRRC